MGFIVQSYTGSINKLYPSKMMRTESDNDNMNEFIKASETL